MRPVSLKRQRVNRLRRKVIARLAVDGPTICPVPWCTSIADSPHEPLTRARGGSITDAANIVLVCHPHNEELTLEPAWGYALGLLKHSWETQ